MRRLCRGSLSLLAAASLTGGLLACGGASSTSTTTVGANTPATTAATSAASAPASTAAQTHTVAEPASHHARSGGSGSASSGGGSAHSGGAASSFHVQGGDNSIPEYGQEAAASERARAEAVLTSFLQARARGEWSGVCATLARPVREQMERFAKAAKARAGAPVGCSGVLKALMSGAAATRANPLVGGVVSLRVKGAAAFALFHGPHASKYVMPMRRESGAWRVSQLAPLPYPLGTAAPSSG